MKYQLQPQSPLFDERGFTTRAGWAVIYNYDPDTGEYIDATYEFIPAGVRPQGSACLDAPTPVDENCAIVRIKNSWTYPTDNRGQTVYIIATGEKHIFNKLGDIPPDYTLLAPTSEFDSWDGEKWVLDTDKQQQHYINIATAQKKQLLNDANEQIDYLQDAIDANIATDNEKILFAEWKKFRVLLNRIDVNQAPNIDWPNKPGL
ncbi:tail fiber assembly protein [Gilliamella apicola]|uniref:tail fiber assembly protein n=1 Tax=Gilliamella apicola TaxID=1196095 RepID=UPI00080E4816|nr:tail fiber assembly protein [Gilliamella apicola]OCG09692.1 hypothetical protein A9G14_11870 [Gilliamella apicola]